MKYCALASGSNGNCYYVANGEDVILIDVGINTKHVLLRMCALDIRPESIKAIFITHEHTDHICGLSVFCKRFQIPVYLTEGSYKGSRLNLPDHLVNMITPNEKVQVGSLSIYGIPKYHDAKEPCSFMVSDGRINLAVLTDIGRGCENVKRAIKHADVLLLESNYDAEMLRTGRYSYYLKNRISAGWGHISNTEALNLFLENRSPRLKHLILGHLSGQNNTEELVLDTFREAAAQLKLSIATRYRQTELYDSEDLSPIAVVAVHTQLTLALETTQLCLIEEKTLL